VAGCNNFPPFLFEKIFICSIIKTQLNSLSRVQGRDWPCDPAGNPLRRLLKEGAKSSLYFN